MDEELHGVLLEVAYDGAAFHGWAAQPGVRTVHGTLFGAIMAMDHRATEPRGASRTDAGVHAVAQLVAFESGRRIPPRGWVLGLNRHLPDDVAVRSACAVPPGYTPRFAARGKRYRYHLVVDPVRDPRWRARAWRVPDIDLDAVREEGAAAVGTHDFAGFRSARDARQTTVRTLSRVDVERGADAHAVSIAVEGNAFLYNMVRILVGTMVDVGRGRLAKGAVARTLESRERRTAGTTAPAHGLVLEGVEAELPPETGERWPR